MPLEDDRVRRLRAVAHPVRLQILSLLTGAEMSAAEIARELGITQANASYHVRVLARAGQLVEARVENVRGGRAKKYRYVPGGRESAHADGETAPPAVDDEALLVEAYAAELRRRFALRRCDGRGDSTDAELWLEPQVWERVVELVHEASLLAHASALAPRTPGTVRTSFTAALFEMRKEDERS
jgi:DNA-binding transcriptional ArsR family regulator